MTDPSKPATKRDVLEQLDNNRLQLLDAISRYANSPEHIAAWDNGLAVVMRDGESFVASPIYATAWPDLPKGATFTNGKGERATMQRRIDVLARDLAKLESLIEHFKKH